MQPFRYHVFYCEQQKPEGVPCCAASGARQVADALRREVAARGLIDDVQITACGSLGLCERGPNLLVYPDGVWYSGVRPEDVAEIVASHFIKGVPVERLANTDQAAVCSEILGNRDRHLAAMRARDASGAMPDEILALLRGFQESRALLTAVELDVFNALGGGSAAVEAAARMETDPRATEMLLNALTAMGLLEKSGGVFRNTPRSARYFTSPSADDGRMAAMHQVRLWRTWSTLTDAVRAGTSVAEPEPDQPLWTEAFIAAMHKFAADGAAPVVRAIGTAGIRRMLDVGGGSGAYSIAFARASQELHAEVLDRAPVLRIAEGHIGRAGLQDRVTVREGDLRRDHFGTGYDLVLLSAICHMLSPDENRGLLGRCYEALAPGGRVAIREFILTADKTAPKAAALFSLNMLVGTRAGASYSEDEYAEWLREAGFADIRHVRIPGPSGVILGVRG
jgi:(2Fe-2S) ferredoxin/SAM-dependent methyltransferase